MNKIEEILQSKETYDPEYPTISISDALEAMKEFGKICFEASRDHAWHFIDEYSGFEKNKYRTYENFLKEIEDET
jgi:hypothetical protein